MADEYNNKGDTPMGFFNYALKDVISGSKSYSSNAKTEDALKNEQDLENKTYDLMKRLDAAQQISHLIDDRQYATALYALDNFDGGKKDALYGYMAISLCSDIESGDVGGKTRQLAEQCLDHCIENCGYLKMD